jgi:hypothetical protein
MKSIMKNLHIKIFVAVCLWALSPSDLFSFTIKWKVTEGSWSGMYIYAWQIDNESNHLLGDWPGTKVNAGSDGWYSVNITDGLTVGVVINGGNDQPQLGDIKPLSADACYNVNLQARTYSLLNCETGEPVLTPAYTIKWKVVDGAWGEMYIYAYAGNPEKNFGDWPGTKVTATEGWYRVNIPAGQIAGKVIFNNGNGSQLPGQGEDGISVTESACFELDLIQLIPPTLIDCGTTEIGNIQPENTIVYSDRSGKLEIRSKKEIAGINIYNLLGNRLINEKNTASSVNINDLNAGIYLVSVTFADGSAHSQKIVKK